jgi:peptide/nickel transport system permease protein
MMRYMTSVRNKTKVASKGTKILLGNPRTLIALALLVPIVSGSILAPIITPHSPTKTNPVNSYESPNLEHPFGTDHLGRDLFSRVLFGGRTSLILGLAASGLAVAAGTSLGILAGYKGGWVDEIVMRIMDGMMSFPPLLLALLIVAMIGSNLINAVLAIAFVYTPQLARVSRSSTLSIKNKEFIKAAEAQNRSTIRIAFFEILPNVVSSTIVEGTIRVGFAIMIGTSLSFLGLGTQPPFPDWGFMIAASRGHLYNSIWYLLWPSLALALTILSFNLLGDGLQEILDPQETSESL